MVKKITNVPKWPFSDKNEEQRVKEVLESGNWWRNAGEQVIAFEKEFAEYQNAKGGITVANGTVALEIALKALGISCGDEVIVPDFTFYSTVSAVLAVKAVPVIVDVCADTFCIDPSQIEKVITDKTKAVIPVHMAGNICDMDAINSIAEKYNIAVIEDAAHAHGAFWKNRGAGSLGTISTFSFQNAKLMTSGEGGIILSDDEEILHNVLLESNCGREVGDTTYQHVIVGTNARLSEFQGAILREQLKRLPEQVALREKNYEYLSRQLQEIPGICMQKINSDVTVNPHYMVMFYYDREQFGGLERSSFVQYLREAGIPCNRSFEAIHRIPVFKTLEKDTWRMVSSKEIDGEGHCINSEKISENVVCLNHNLLIGDEKLLDDIVEVIKNFGK